MGQWIKWRLILILSNKSVRTNKKTNKSMGSVLSEYKTILNKYKEKMETTIVHFLIYDFKNKEQEELLNSKQDMIIDIK
jgi:hypothetical protein